MRVLSTFGFLLVAIMAVGCTSEEPAGSPAMKSEVSATLASMRSEDPSFGPFIDQTYGYVVFPSVGKGGLIVGGAHGQGDVYEQGRLIGYATMTQGTIGAQAGGQEFSEVICFRNKEALVNFTSGKFEPTAEATAVAVKAGAASTAAYSHNVAMFTYVKGGLMAEAAIGGQKFSFTPLESPRIP